jgi:ribonuclease P protein component
MVALTRLKRRAEFLRVAASRRKWVAPGFILQALPQPAEIATPALAQVRIGFTASRKVGGAVVRNRARRRLKAAVAQLMPLHAAPSHDYVLIARAKTTTRRPYADLVDDLERGLRRLGLWRDEQ